MRRVRLIIEYEGTAFVGWQIQENGLSVQQCIETALFRVTGSRIALFGSGRTDSGVHARAQVAHFDTDVRMPADKFAIALNMLLPPEIRILYSEETDASFHARFSAKQKHYRYTVQTGPHARVFTRNTALFVHAPLDFAAMQAASVDCVGEHDFRAFMSSGTVMENTVRTVFSSGWTQDGAYLHYDITGNGFLYNMVRILAGTMLDIGKGLLPQDAIRRSLESRRRSDAGATAPAHGLTLLGVRYSHFDTDEVLSRL